MNGTGPVSTVSAAVRAAWWRRLGVPARFRRTGQSGIAVLQIVLAATAAFAFSVYVLGHPAPLLAATTTLASLGLARDARPVRVFEAVVGMLLGIAIAEVTQLVAGSGWWQLAVALGVTLLVARFCSPAPSFAVAAGIQSIIVMIVVSPTPFLRLIDGVVGGVAALLVTALVPRNPMAAEQRDGRALVDQMSAATDTLIQALRRGDRVRAERGLEKARGLQVFVDDWRTSLDSGIAIARIAPFLRRRRSELLRHEGMRLSLDFAARNLRVVARRVVYLCDDGAPRPVAAGLLAELARGLQLVGDALDDAGALVEAREVLHAVAVQLDPRALLPGGSLGDHSLIGALRPLTVDLLTATGLSAADARAIVPRI